LAWAFSHFSVIPDYGLNIPSVEVVDRMIQERGGKKFYNGRINLGVVKDCIRFLKQGGDSCSGEIEALDLTQRFLSLRGETFRILETWMLV
jgi:hypothetical protein